MNSEVEITETPNWLKELEAKREQRLKARLGHEAGAGAPCLKCGDKCPGLDLHFWRKCCKICKCSKEEHEVQDDDIYGWAQFQLLGNRPNKIKSKIVLPGKKDELELDWVPKGNKETVEKYLKTLPADQLPVKGTKAAQERKQLLHKQIPIHDIDPALCHELNEDELKQMNEYIAYVKKNSVGVGQIVNLSSIIKGNLHILNPSDAALIASRYPKGVPLSEIVKLQSQSKSENLSRRLEKMSVANLPNYKAKELGQLRDVQNPVTPASKVHDKIYPVGVNDENLEIPTPMYSHQLKPGSNNKIIDARDPYNNQTWSSNPQNPRNDPLYPQDPKLIPLESVNQMWPNYDPKSGLKPITSEGIDPKLYRTPHFDPKSQIQNYDPKSINYNYNSSNPNFNPKLPSQFLSQQQNITGFAEPRTSAFVPYSKAKPVPGEEVPTFPEMATSSDNLETVENLKQGRSNLPNYAPGKYDIFTDRQTPSNVLRNMKDLAFSTYDPSKVEMGKAGEFQIPNRNKGSFESELEYPQGSFGSRSRAPGAPEDYSESNKVPGDTSQLSHHKPLSEFRPTNHLLSEDFLHPSQVTIGPIQDINYPEIKAALEGTNDFYEDYSPDSIKEILNNVKLPDCHHCKKPFEENEFAVTIERANVLFHAECFRCAGCNQILADNVYFYSKENDNIYCGRDYAKIRGFPRCKACDELIFTKEYCLAENSTFHLKHFCCIECDTPLAGQDYTLEEGMPYCLPCFEHSKASKCNACERIIKPDEIGCNLNGVHFHADDKCFACKICGKALMGKKLLLRNQRLFCSHECFGQQT